MSKELIEALDRAIASLAKRQTDAALGLPMRSPLHGQIRSDVAILQAHRDALLKAPEQNTESE